MDPGHGHYLIQSACLLCAFVLFELPLTKTLQPVQF